MDPATISKILYYTNQGGSGLLVLALYGAYAGYKLLNQLLAAIVEQNELLKKFIEKETKP